MFLYRSTRKEEKRLYDIEYRSTHEKERRDHYIKNREHIVTYQLSYRSKNKQKKAARDATRKEEKAIYRFKHKKEIAISAASWAKANRGKLNAKRAKRRSVKLQATPKWLTEKHHQDMEDTYVLARELQWLSEEKLEVDHIIPLQGKDVSGLHVPWNLQILPKSMNRSKGNRFK
jgi:5-methylcytosine-specific restriction endonuclease McrA